MKNVEDQATTKSQKIQLYNELAAAAANVDKVDEAISYFGKKHQLDPSTARADALVLAQLYERLGDSQDALAQYKLALEYYESLPDGDMSVDARVEGLKAIIKELETVDE